ncbi:hypothetical protein OCB08_17775 [Bacillus cereus]|jgi:preprotein translocase subunit SecG|uniref:Uncharacterized protein n=1 Tax=Bacillus mobilis TaxID=2026190 RepID=A0ABV4RYX2_9BACI|nr:MULTISPECIES: hypothetical protein [Bacillus]MBL3889397.1 hypothetical protein [Bacillus cereus]MCC2368512.1 hypothetical protein [Bacillus cereus]MCC2396593.1 hypothetical protein [Bacillus cereus]MCC2451524.1 hypothetical protein [Bacillus cereus]MCC2461899.1 hypothetical protein [Bacillus mobilis]
MNKLTGSVFFLFLACFLVFAVIHEKNEEDAIPTVQENNEMHQQMLF